MYTHPPLFLAISILIFSFLLLHCWCPQGLTLAWWGCYSFCLWHKPTELAHSCLFCSFFCLCLYGSFNCILFHKFSQQLSALSLCSSGLISAVLVLSTIYLFMKVSPSLNIILCGWLSLQHQPTNKHCSLKSSLNFLFRVLGTVENCSNYDFWSVMVIIQAAIRHSVSVCSPENVKKLSYTFVSYLPSCLFSTTHSKNYCRSWSNSSNLICSPQTIVRTMDLASGFQISPFHSHPLPSAP